MIEAEDTLPQTNMIYASGDLCEDNTEKFRYSNEWRRCNECGLIIHKPCFSSDNNGMNFICKREKFIKEKLEHDNEEI